MRPGGTPIGENFELKTPSNVIFHTEQEYEIHFFLSQKIKISDPYYWYFSLGVHWTPRHGLEKRFVA